MRNLKTEILCNLPKDTLWGNFRAWIQTQICLVPKFIYSTSNLPFCLPICTTKQAYKGLYWMRPWSISNDFKIIWEKWSGDHPIGYCLEKLLSWKIFSKLFLTSPTPLISLPGSSEYPSLPQTLRVESPLNITQLTSSVCIEGNYGLSNLIEFTQQVKVRAGSGVQIWSFLLNKWGLSPTSWLRTMSLQLLHLPWPIRLTSNYVQKAHSGLRFWDFDYIFSLRKNHRGKIHLFWVTA